MIVITVDLFLCFLPFTRMSFDYNQLRNKLGSFTPEADQAHDTEHLRMVYNLAIEIAGHEGIIDDEDLHLIKLAALLHEVDDRKQKLPYRLWPIVSDYLKTEMNVPQSVIDDVFCIVKNVSYSHELEAGNEVPEHLQHLLYVVQDADRLQAIGAFGVARAFIYGASVNTPMYDPSIPPKLGMTAEEYKKHKGTTINHFYEKLFLLKDKIKTETGKKIAEKRHDFMVQFVHTFIDEYYGRT